MNIFVLDKDIERCAQYHCDQHVSKMILESVQILCPALVNRGLEAPYKPTHRKHPCVLWAQESWDNFEWLAQLARALNTEYRYRYDRPVDHASIPVLEQIVEPQFESRGLTDFAQAMPQAYKAPGDAVTAYRSFYLGEKVRFAKWTRRREPAWWLQAH